jgi:hypothetical protein
VRHLGLICALALVACDNDPPRKWPYPYADGGLPGVDGGTVLRATNIEGIHVASCSDDTACGTNATNPPVGGNHCAVWLNCRKYDTAQPRCQWLHNLEHGHAALLYNCPNGCAETVQKLGALWDSLQTNPARKRILLTPDPKLPRKVAAVVWGFGWMGDEFDEAAILEVLSHQDKEAPEANLGCSP